MDFKTTIKESTPRICGVNVFPPGRKNFVRFHPAENDEGIVFIVGKEKIPATLKKAFHHMPFRSVYLASCISLEGEKEKAVKVEHIMSLVYGLGIDNIVIELSDGVVPRQDLGINEMFEALNPIICETATKREYLCVNDILDELTRTVTHSKKDDKLIVKQSDNFSIDYTAYYPHKIVGNQNYLFSFSKENYEKEIMNARSVFFLPFDGKRFLIDSVLKYFHGVNESNSLIIGSKEQEHFLNNNYPKGMYDSMHFVRHKIMDFMCPLALTGHYYKNTMFEVYKSGHNFDIYSLKTLFGRDCFIPYV